MVSIIPRVDLLGNTVVDWISKLSYFRLDTLTMFSQDSGINDDVFFGGHGTMRTMPSPNMAIGDIASFANSLPEETQYLEQLLTNQVK